MSSKLKRRLILLLTIILLGGSWYYLANLRPWDLRIPVGASKKQPDYEFQVMSISEVSGDRTFYRISANSLVLDRAQGLLEQVSGSILENNRPALDFTADDGVLDVVPKIFTFNNFSGRTLGNNRRVWTIVSPRAVWDNKVQKFTFTPQPRLANGEINISSDKMIYDLRFNIFSLDTGCEVQTGEYTLRGDSAVLKNAFNILTVEDNVSLTGKDFQLRADYLDWFVQSSELFFKNNVQMQADEVVLTAGAVSLNTTADMIYMNSDVRMQVADATQNIIVNTERAVWNRKEEKIEFFENTRAWRNDSMIESEQLVYDLQNNELITTGEGRTKIIRADY